jgi:hypothetical protein
MIRMHRCAPTFVIFTLVALASATVGCVDPLTSHPVATPVWEVRNVIAYGETAAGPSPDIALGWDLRVAGGVARWRECTAPDACSDIARERPADQLIAFERVGRRADRDGRELDVVRLSLAPRPTYVVPMRKLPR